MKSDTKPVRVSDSSHKKLLQMQEAIFTISGTKLSLSDITNLLIHKSFIKDITFLLGMNK